jgi:hypothetical protein
LQQATAALFRARKLNALTSCVWTVPSIVAAQVPRRWSPVRQPLGDQLAGILAIDDR